ncbi:DUF4270 family protein [Flavobacteriaceae bacterium AU392]|nr:DUF4270 domain-containing protein [Flavobacteriaceae bacterium]RKM84657.1 DUF4270 family protein [Flavobacteriaceae bacterium AU392]
MKNIKNIIKNIAFLAVLTTAIIACENDFASVGSDIIGGDNFNTANETFPIITHNKRITPLQSSNLPNYLLGYFNDPVYGGSTANIVSQMSLPLFDPVFTGENQSVVVDSIIFTLPYFSDAIPGTNIGNNIPEFSIDSIFGDPNNPIRLSIHENNFFLRDFDPNSDQGNDQIYFSNGSTSETDIIPQSLLEGELLFQNNNFFPNLRQITLTEVDQDTGEIFVTQRLTPAIRVRLDNPNSFWEDLIFNREGQPELSNRNNFNDHFRGIYIKAEPVNDNGSMTLFDLSNGNITIFYTVQDNSNNTTQGSPESLILSFTGNTVNIFNNDFIPLADGDPQNGDDRLFLKGGEGSMAIINLFNGDENGDSSEFENFKNSFIDGTNIKRLVNEAFLDFHVDQSIVQGEEPDRVYIYDLNNNIPLIDYFLDQSVTVDSPEARNIHLRPLTRVDNDPNGEGLTYRIRITDHINNLILRDSTNVKLGLVVAGNVDSGSVLDLPLLDENQIAERVPIGTFLSPRGTVLIGNNTNDVSRRPVLRVFFTEPNN